jgi:Flp pilus assembly protein TadD
MFRRDARTSSDEAEAARAGVADAPDDPHALARRGQALLRAGDPEGAEAAFREAIRLGPEVGNFHLALADALHAQGNMHAALAVVHARVSSGTPDAHSFGRYGRLLGETGNLSGAERAFRQAIALDPTVENFHRGLAKTLDAMGRDREAAAVRLAAPTAQPSPASGVGRLARLMARLTGRSRR